jgi:Transmembrane secretion effector
MAVAGMPLLAVTVLHAGTVAVAAITASAYLPWLIIGLPAGAWVDRLPCRRLMITCDIMFFTFYASLPASAWAGELTIAQVIAARPEPGPLGNGSAAIPAGTCGPGNRAERGFRRAGTERDARCPRRTRTWSAAW